MTPLVTRSTTSTFCFLLVFFSNKSEIISWAVWQQAARALQHNSSVSVAAAGWLHSWGLRLCLGAQRQRSRGLWSRTRAAPPVEQVDTRAACPGWPPPRQCRFYKVGVTCAAPSTTVYVTDLVNRMTTWHLTFLCESGGLEATSFCFISAVFSPSRPYFTLEV